MGVGDGCARKGNSRRDPGSKGNGRSCLGQSSVLIESEDRRGALEDAAKGTGAAWTARLEFKATVHYFGLPCMHRDMQVLGSRDLGWSRAKMAGSLSLIWKENEHLAKIVMKVAGALTVGVDCVDWVQSAVIAAGASAHSTQCYDAVFVVSLRRLHSALSAGQSSVNKHGPVAAAATAPLVGPDRHRRDASWVLAEVIPPT